MTVVVDASLVVSALIDGGEEGEWALEVLGSGSLAAPHLMPVEVANVLRGGAMTGRISSDSAAMAHADLHDLQVALFPYAPFSSRAWELKENLTAYDGWYVALAEFLGAELATMDARLSRAAGPNCGFLRWPE